MRWGSLISVLVMAVLSVGLPRLVFNSAGLDEKSLIAMVGQIKAVESGANLDARVDRQWRALKNGQVDHMSLEQLAAVEAIQSQRARIGRQSDMGAALLKAFQEQKPLGDQWRAQVLRESETLRRLYSRSRQRVLAALLLAAVGLAVVIVLGTLPILRGLARFLLGMAFGLSGRWLVLVSLCATAYFAAGGLNPWPLLPTEVFAAPVGCMLLSGVFLRILDPNYPMWNTLLMSFSAPIAACLAISGYIQLKPGA
ncbi:MAG: hypothetical protein A2X40_12420 [Elusimicrobia bacterium GWC2_65_9]|nr:MAG: hypothetical protein A2X40_12420 [Elusimicrobia bacterium GWC2_65_9]